MGQLIAIKNKHLNLAFCDRYLLKKRITYSRAYAEKLYHGCNDCVRGGGRGHCFNTRDEIECARCAIIKCAMKTASGSFEEVTRIQGGPIEMQRMREEI